MAEDNSSRVAWTEVVLPSALSNVGDWCGLPVVTNTGVVVGTITIVSPVVDPHGDLVLHTCALTGVGVDDE